MHSFFVQWTVTVIIYVAVRIVPDWPRRAPLNWLLCPLICCHYSWNMSSLSGARRCSFSAWARESVLLLGSSRSSEWRSQSHFCPLLLAVLSFWPAQHIFDSSTVSCKERKMAHTDTAWIGWILFYTMFFEIGHWWELGSNFCYFDFIFWIIVVNSSKN